MSESFRDFMEAASSGGGDTPPEGTPEPTATESLATQPAQGTPEPEPSSADTATATGSDDDLRSFLEARKAARPELADEIDAIHKEFQRGLTPKLQERSELLKFKEQFEGIDPADVQFIRQVNELALVNPQAAAQMLETARQQMLGNYGAEPEPDPEEWDYATPAEQKMHQDLQQMKAWQQQEIAARNQLEMERIFSTIREEFGQDVPQPQKEAAARWCLQRGLKADSIGIAWRGLYGAQLAKQAGRNEAAQFVERKSAMTPGPSGIANPPAAPPGEPKSLREALERSRVAQ